MFVREGDGDAALAGRFALNRRLPKDLVVSGRPAPQKV
jgi:hypothetical protein